MTNSNHSPEGMGTFSSQEITTLSDLAPDSRNANKGTDRGLEMIRASLAKHGAARSIVLDRHGRIVAGNQTVRAAGLAGMDDVIVVRTDGRKIVAVQRTDIDLDSPEGRELACLDNRSAEIGLSWDADVLSELQAEGVDFSELFSGEELDALLGELEQSEGLDADGPWPESLPGAADGFGGPQAGQRPHQVAAPLPHAAGSGEGPSAAPAPSLDSAPSAPDTARPLGPQGPPSHPSAPPSGVSPGHLQGIAFREFDESVAEGMTVYLCPSCGHRWAV